MNQLTVLEKMTPAEIFTARTIDMVLEKIHAECEQTPTDATTEKGRKEIASLAYKVARSKTFIDDAGKRVGEEYKLKLDQINDERKKARDYLDKLKDSIRKPVDEWEQKEQHRVQKHQQRIQKMVENLRFVQANAQAISVESIEEYLEELSIYQTMDWEEFKDLAEKTLEFNKAEITRIRDQAIIRDQERAELEALRAQKALQEQKDRDARIAEQARLEAEEKARKEAERAANEAEEKRLLEIAKTEAAKKAQELAEKRAKEAEERLEQEKKKAVEAEKLRAAKALADEEMAKQKREAQLKAAEEKRRKDMNLRNTVFAEASEGLMAMGFDKPTSLNILDAISSGKVRHVTLVF